MRTVIPSGPKGSRGISRQCEEATQPDPSASLGMSLSVDRASRIDSLASFWFHRAREMDCPDWLDSPVCWDEFLHHPGDPARSLQSGARVGFLWGKTAMGERNHDDYHADASESDRTRWRSTVASAAIPL